MPQQPEGIVSGQPCASPPAASIVTLPPAPALPDGPPSPVCSAAVEPPQQIQTNPPPIRESGFQGWFMRAVSKQTPRRSPDIGKSGLDAITAPRGCRKTTSASVPVALD